MGQAEFDYLVENMRSALTAPDAHFDCIYMLSDAHWVELKAGLSLRQTEWREAFAYVLCQGPVEHAFPLLTELLQDVDPNVARQSADSIMDLLDLHPGLDVPSHVLTDAARLATSRT